MTLGELAQTVVSNPGKYLDPKATTTMANSKSKKKSSKRTRRRVDNPQQTYLYKAQRDRLAQSSSSSSVNATTSAQPSEDDKDAVLPATFRTTTTWSIAHELGMAIGAQHCQPDIDAVPTLVGSIPLVSSIDGTTNEPFSAQYAYVLYKPSGWAIVGSVATTSTTTTSSSGAGGGVSRASTKTKATQPSQQRKPLRTQKRVRFVEEDGSTDVLEYNEMDVLALLTPEERYDYEIEQGWRLPGDDAQDVDNDTPTMVDLRLPDRSDDDEFDGEEEEDGAGRVVDDDDVVEMDPVRRANLERIRARRTDAAAAVFAPRSRPSLVGWLKEHWEVQGRPVRGGTYWTAVAGATHVDDTGLVVLVPRHQVAQLQIAGSAFVAVVGTGGSLAKAVKGDHTSSLEFEVLSRLRKGRPDDPVQVVQVRSPDATKCTSASVVAACQDKFQEGIRGDPEANPMDRRAPRRLLHCSELTVVSSQFTEPQTFESKDLPMDMAGQVDRVHSTKLFTRGAFLGRSALRNSNVTNAYREINGAADGYPGWIVDRYDKWLYVQHDPDKTPLGPLPSIHDGNTAGVYVLEQSSPVRLTDGANRPRLLEGQPAPERFPIVENGITYLVSFQDISTGIFLDQRPQRAWLARNCCPDTRVLNCFAHAGAFSVAAAAAGASTVSIDLSRKWLERLPDQLQVNGIDFDHRHDAIYGDCFDWLARLAKRGEKYDIVILDPPSTSVGGQKKKRWSIKNDMDELVCLASGLVKKGGLLWTTTNSASIQPLQFARLCKKGMDSAGFSDCKLERIQPMPGDFPTIGPQPVKNYVWRFPL